MVVDVTREVYRGFAATSPKKRSAPGSLPHPLLRRHCLREVGQHDEQIIDADSSIAIDIGSATTA